MCSRPFRPLGLPIYVARVPAAPFTRRYPSRLCLLCRFAQKLHSLGAFCPLFRGRVRSRTASQGSQRRTAALARSFLAQSARKSFISALSPRMRRATPLYFFVVPVIVRLTAP